MKFLFPYTLLLMIAPLATAQQAAIQGVITDARGPISFANIYLQDRSVGASSDSEGHFTIEHLPAGDFVLVASAIGYRPLRMSVHLEEQETKWLSLHLDPEAEALDETVVTGTLKTVSRMESPVPVEVYSPAFLKTNPTPNIFEALQHVNGVRPQINCNVCNTGDIHINGLEGPYTLVLIDGMPIVSGLGTVYGLSGIPNALIKQIEIVKGPASTLYGSEAMGGLINIITKNTPEAPDFFADGFVTGWGEYNLDLGAKAGFGSFADLLLGVNYFNYNQPIDRNGDNFTDVTLQERISLFQKWNFKRHDDRIFSIAGRFYHEDRWGGEMQWTPQFRGTDVYYGESIYTRRWEWLGKYQLPMDEKVLLTFSYNNHHQDSFYGTLPFLADQRIGFMQLTWDTSAGLHDLLFGSSLRYNYYDDNTTATSIGERNAPDKVWIPSLFVQDEIALAPNHSLLLGLRYDYDRRHGSILTPRAAYRWKLSDQDILRFNAGTGFRVVNIFTEDHAALTGAREVVITESLKPEQSINFNLNYLKKIYTDEGTYVGLDASCFYTYFSNVILPDYDTDPNLIIYDNLNGHSVSRGISTNLDLAYANGLKILLGATWQDVRNSENGVTRSQILTEYYSGTWNISYEFHGSRLLVDYSGTLYGPMRLPLLGELDPRREYSPAWSIQNIQLTFKGLHGLELYGGVKNLLNWTPNRGNPFIIARANDPFDKEVTFDAQGKAVATPDNPYALTFDPSYVYAPNQGIRGFLGMRYRIAR